jgi:hypothetical protein
MLMVWGIDRGAGRRARMGVESIFPGVPILKLSTAGRLWVRRCCRIRGQSKEGQGRPVDAKGRHRTCALIIVTSKHKEREAIAPP